MPLAAIGFTTTGLLFAVFAYSFYSLTNTKVQAILKSFSYSYFSLSLAFICWGLAALANNQNILNLSVLGGNVLLLLTTFFLSNILLPRDKKYKILGLTGVIFLSLLFLWWRITYFPPHPLIVNGILLFNTQPPVALTLSLIILSIWLPANIKTAFLISEKIKIDGFSYIYSSVYVMATVAAIIFISARTIPVLILSFVGILVCFAMLVFSNIIIDRLSK